MTIEFDLEQAIDKHIERIFDKFVEDNKENYNYRFHSLADVIQEKLAEKFIQTYSDEIFKSIAKDETLAVMVREKVIENLARSLHR